LVGWVHDTPAGSAKPRPCVVFDEQSARCHLLASVEHRSQMLAFMRKDLLEIVLLYDRNGAIHPLACMLWLAQGLVTRASHTQAMIMGRLIDQVSSCASRQRGKARGHLIEALLQASFG